MVQNYRIVVVGEGGVGKSCLTIQFINEKFVEEYDPTMEETYRKQLTVDDEEVLLDIFDTAGQEDFSAVRDQYMRTGDGFICIYSITLEQSFNAVQRFHDHILRVKDADTDDLPFVMAGNKCDLEGQRVVTKEEGQQLSEKLHCKWVETSAKTRQNVVEVFEEIVREVRKWKKVNEPETVVKKKKSTCVLL